MPAKKNPETPAAEPKKKAAKTEAPKPKAAAAPKAKAAAKPKAAAPKNEEPKMAPATPRKKRSSGGAILKMRLNFGQRRMKKKTRAMKRGKVK